MGKRSTGRKRGILRGVGKYKIKIPRLTEQNELSIFEVNKSFIAVMGAKGFELFFKTSVFFHLVPFRRTESGKYVPLTRKQKMAHVAVLFVGFAFATHKTLAALEMLLLEGMTAETFICVCVFLLYLAPMLISLGVWAQPEETMDLLNSWPYVLPCVQEIRGEGLPVLSPFEDVNTTLKIMSSVLVTLVIVPGAGLMAVFMNNLPVWLLPLAQRLGLIPPNLLPPIGWKLLFMPLEYLTLIPPLMMGCFTVAILFVLVGNLKLYLQELR